MRIIARFEKSEEARFVSHLDIQRAFQRAMQRAGFPMAYSQGFNPHQLVSFATALAVGYTSSSEWVDVKFSQSITTDEFVKGMNSVLPQGFAVAEAKEVADNAKSLTAIMRASEYEITFSKLDKNAVDELMSSDITVMKRTKGGMKEVNIRPDVFAYSVIENKLLLTGRLDAAGSLNIELLLCALKEKMPGEWTARVHRNNIIFNEGEKVTAL
ncbi:MAG: DUF2344 domain-containing protein [Clostridia bacterium]|nr:DUF2344 domain-containing protein [Clostridia bacterium]